MKLTRYERRVILYHPSMFTNANIKYVWMKIKGLLR